MFDIILECGDFFEREVIPVCIAPHIYLFIYSKCIHVTGVQKELWICHCYQQ